MEITGRVALLCGGARIGRSVAEELAKRGCQLALSYRTSREPAEAVAEQARRAGVDAELFQADLQSEHEVRDLVAKVEERFQRLDFLVNLASVYREIPLELLSSRDWNASIDTDAFSSFALALECAAHMKKQGAGRIVLFSDWLPSSERPRYRGYLPYYVSKAAVKALAEALALELAPEVLVNAVAPGPVLQPDDMSPEEARKVAEVTPLQRWGGSQEVARTVIFLLETDFITGECIRVDGGRHLY